MKDLLGDSHLLQIILSRVGVVGIHHNCRIFQPLLVVHVTHRNQILVVIVRKGASPLVHIAPKNRMGVRISVAGYLPASVYKGMGALGCDD